MNAKRYKKMGSDSLISRWKFSLPDRLGLANPGHFRQPCQPGGSSGRKFSFFWLLYKQL